MKDAQFVWIDACQESFLELKKMISTPPILRGSNWSLPFHISLDAWDATIGAVLGQQEGHSPYFIYYVIKNMAPIELNYMVTEKEFLSIIYSINKFRNYITGYSNFVHSNHSAIR